MNDGITVKMEEKWRERNFSMSAGGDICMSEM